MMKMKLFLLTVFSVSVFFTSNLMAQEEENEKPSKFSAGADFYTSYVWRGTKFGTGPAVQPSVNFSAGGLTLGAWGSFDASGTMESDLYASYSFPFGLSLGVTDYYYPGLEYFDYTDTTGSHAFELNAGYTLGGLSLSANYILNEAGGAASAGNDLYFQAGYAFKHADIFVGAGNGWHTSDGEFAVCNIGIGISREIKITEYFSLPVSGQVIFNPEREQFYVVVGFSL
ncbi:MAG: hypothetical protein JXK95_09950 [Bacteroidales bacterium]|nr:hypothetical protein [Bacteroidales bacterium]